MREMREWPLRLWWLGSYPLDSLIHRGLSDAEVFSEFGLGVVPRVVQFEQVLGLVRLQFGLLAAQPALGLRDFHPFAGAQSDQVGFERSRIANTLNSSRPTGSVGSWIDPPRLS